MHLLVCVDNNPKPSPCIFLLETLHPASRKQKSSCPNAVCLVRPVPEIKVENHKPWNHLSGGQKPQVRLGSDVGQCQDCQHRP